MKAKAALSQIHTGQKIDVELLGQLDFQPNYYNEKVVALDIDKILYYIGLGVSVQEPVLQILGILGMWNMIHVPKGSILSSNFTVILYHYWWFIMFLKKRYYL